jgi:hypothetical protein
VIQGVRTGVVRIPLRIICADECERGETMFGFAIMMDSLGAIAALALAAAIWGGIL